MHISIYALAGISAGIINTIGLVPYIRDIFRHKTKPERAMWWIYAVLFSLLFAAQLKAGASWLLCVTAAYILSSILIAILSLRYGYGSFHKRDMFSLVIVALGLLLWLITSQPLLAIILVIIVDFAGFWLTLFKTWHAPRSETLVAWELACLAAIISVFSIKTVSLSVIIYPLYAVLGSGLLVCEIIYRRARVEHDLEDI